MATRTKITVATIARLPREGRDLRIWDTRVAGFHIRARASGKAVYAIRYVSKAGSEKLVTIGDVGSLSPDAAREAARRCKEAVALGDDPAAERDQARREITFAELMRRTIEAPSLRTGKPRSPRTLVNMRSRAKRHILPALGAKRITEIARENVEAMKRRLVDKPTTANRCLEDVAAAFNFAVDRELILASQNPTTRVRAYSEAKRVDAFNLRPREVGLILNSLRALEAEKRANPQAVLALRIAAFAGWRIGGVQDLRWENLHDALTRVEFESKGRRHRKSVPGEVVGLLRGADRRGPFVIFGQSTSKPLDYKTIRKVFRRALEHAADACGDPFVAQRLRKARVNDFRHFNLTTYGSRGANAFELTQHAGHASPAMTNAYLDQLPSVAERADDAARSIAALERGGAADE